MRRCSIFKVNFKLKIKLLMGGLVKERQVEVVVNIKIKLHEISPLRFHRQTTLDFRSKM